MQNLAWLVILFYIIGVTALIIAGFTVMFYLGLVILGVAFIVPAVVLYKELKEGD